MARLSPKTTQAAPIKRILLVNPPLSREERFGSLADGGFSMPPLGLAILASVLRERGYEPQILDLEALQVHGEEALGHILSRKPDLVGFTATTVAIHNAVEVAGRLKQRAAIPTVIGGVHVTALPEDSMARFPCFDYGVYGEGEITFPELLDRLNDGDGLDGVMGVLYREGDGLVTNAPRPFLPHLDDLPFPAYDLLPDMPRYYRPPVFMFERLPSMSIMTSRGCPGKCTFCNHALFGKLVRMHSAEYVVDLMATLKNRFGFRDIQIYDDTFTVNRPRLEEICQLLIDRQLDLAWSASARVDYVTSEMLKLMRRAGCFLISYGIESGDPRVLKAIKKGITPEQVARALAWTREAGIRSKGYLMFGNIGDSPESFRQTEEFVLQLPLDLITSTYFTPMPGSEDYERASQHGRFDNDWRKLSEYTVVFVPQGLTEEVIKSARVRVTQAFYLRPKIILWFLGMLFKPTHFWEVVKGAWMFLKFSLSKPWKAKLQA